MMWNISEEWWEYNETWFEINLNETLSGTNYTEQIGLKANSTRNILIILVYIVLFIIAAVGNLTVFISLFRSRHRRSKISLMIRHLTIADLIVTFVMIPIEVGWRLTGRWLAGNEACKIFQFLRALGPYLSSNVLVCVSLDRYFAVVYPFRINAARQRGKIMLVVAWGASLLYCVPQCFVFHLREHPQIPNFKQCVTFGSFPSEVMELIYNILCIMFLYFIPLSIIIIAYSCIVIEISKTSKGSNGDAPKTSDGQLRLRRSDTKNIERTRSKTLRLTVTIVVIYIFCCTPYTIMTLWYMFDRNSAEKSLPPFLQDIFFMMVVSNSCMNPIVYGSFVIDFRKFSCHCTDCGEKTSTESIIPHQELQMMNKSEQHHLARRFIKHLFGRKGNANITKTSPMIAQRPIKNNKRLEPTNSKSIPHRTVAYRFRHDKFFSEVLQSANSSCNEIVFHSEPIVRCVSEPSEDRNDNLLSTRRNVVDFEFVKIKPNKSCVYFVRNERTFAPVKN